MSYAARRGEISGVFVLGWPALRPSGRPATLYVRSLNGPVVAAAAGGAPVAARPVTASVAAARAPRSLLVVGVFLRWEEAGTEGERCSGSSSSSVTGKGSWGNSERRDDPGLL